MGNLIKQEVSKINGMGEISIRNPQTGKETLYTMDDLEQFTKLPMAARNSAHGGVQNPAPRTSAAIQNLMQSEDHSKQELTRILELAGLKEDGSGGGCSAGGMATTGATVAGNIATVAQPLGKVKKRYKGAEESSDSTVSGKIDPNAATGALAQGLADRKLKSATRKHNGIR
jgi:hypothetical protein